MRRPFVDFKKILSMLIAGDKAKNGVFAYEQNGKKKKGNADNPEAAQLIKKYSLEPKLP